MPFYKVGLFQTGKSQTVLHIGTLADAWVIILKYASFSQFACFVFV